ncbi:S-adenosyl-L-methionine-dependent methyltransferase [Vararia minispora EC-137]|uniref:S-adenosyl-L-methionine-dependent methyltransferase n=1 Tax=Vararia minispora EC-137 TaxID=1314806 RepID=A0ACB8QFZ9_9AGAM|nr:S-adenosyl-L-methionine-dependent methyltransferase [Vararia minispora EC-137]
MLLVTPWDAGVPLPPLINLLKSSKLSFPTAGRALVPGCGKAYDAIIIASILGLESISPVATEAAKNTLTAEDKVKIETADFVELDGTQPFDLIYDYTSVPPIFFQGFFVTLPPRRVDWGRKMSALVRLGSYLIAITAPLGMEKGDAGPSYYVEPGHYGGVLRGEGWEKVLDEDPVDTAARRAWPQKLVVWKRT